MMNINFYAFFFSTCLFIFVSICNSLNLVFIYKGKNSARVEKHIISLISYYHYYSHFHLDMKIVRD